MALAILGASRVSDRPFQLVSVQLHRFDDERGLTVIGEREIYGEDLSWAFPLGHEPQWERMSELVRVRIQALLSHGFGHHLDRIMGLIYEAEAFEVTFIDRG